MNNSSSHMQEKRALIIGGGIAGLLAARVLSEYYGDVLIIERDGRPEQPGPRAGTPQSFHLHQVLPRGEMILERFFPGFSEDLLALGAFSMQNTGVQMINQYGTLAFPGDGKGGLPIVEPCWSGGSVNGCRPFPMCVSCIIRRSRAWKPVLTAREL